MAAPDQRPIAPDDMRSLMTSSQSEARDFVVGGRVRQLEVDSSWGSGHVDETRGFVGEALAGGVQRATWFYNEDSGRWATWDKEHKALLVGATPYGHPVEGFFRGGRP